MDDTVTMRFEWLMTECRLCGRIDPMGRAVIHAKGKYCRSCATLVAIQAQRHTDSQIAAMMAADHITLPVPLFDPLAQ